MVEWFIAPVLKTSKVPGDLAMNRCEPKGTITHQNSAVSLNMLSMALVESHRNHSNET
jgi:hypothetical protein